MSRLFGTDGVRGLANKELTAEMAFAMGRAATCHFGHEAERPKILIGRDTRLSGMMLEAALAAGICSAGGDALLLGVAPTPAVAYLAQELGAQAGVVISASHNPFEDNGIKFFSATGYKLPDSVEDELEEIMARGVNQLPYPTKDGIGRIIPKHDQLDIYYDYLARSIPDSLEGLKIVVDCANGAAYKVAPHIFKRLGAEVIAMYTEPDGININEDCGSTHMGNLQAAVLKHGADIGIAHDGDADRCLIVDETGQIIDGDRIMLICALALKAKGHLKDQTVVATVMSNIGFHQAAKEHGLRVEVASVGDRYVLEKMQAGGYSLGGEQSGHIIFGDLSTTGDGVLTGIQLLAALKSSGKKMSELAAVMIQYPQLLINIRVQSKAGWDTNEAISAAVSASEAELGNNGRILVRPSGTEPLLRVMAEGPDLAQLEELTGKIADVVKQELGSN